MSDGFNLTSTKETFKHGYSEQSCTHHRWKQRIMMPGTVDTLFLTKRTGTRTSARHASPMMWHQASPTPFNCPIGPRLAPSGLVCLFTSWVESPWLTLCIAFAPILFTLIINPLIMRSFLKRTTLDAPADELSGTGCNYPRGIH